MAAERRRVRPFPFDRLARIARGQVEAGRTLRSHLPLVDADALGQAAALAGGPITVALVDSYAFAARDLFSRLPGPPAPALIRIASPGGRFALLALDPALAVRLARRVLSPTSHGVDAASEGFSVPLGSGPLSPLSFDEQRALSGLLDPLLAGVEARVDGFPVDDGEILPLFPDPFVLALDARVKTPAGQGWARLLCPDRLRVQASLPLRRAALWARRGRLSAARVTLPMEIGRTRITRAEFAELATGDVILFEEFGPRPPFGGALSLRLGRGAISAWLDGEGLTVIKGFELGGGGMDGKADPNDRMSEEGRAREEGGTDALLRELPVEVVCELGRVTMSGRELLELRPGAVIPIGRPLAGPVDLTVGGRVVGRGELVDVEGEIGVRLIQVNE